MAQPMTLTTTGGGRTVDEYIVHQCEMVVKKIGKDVKKVICNVQGGQSFFNVHFESGKQATMIFGAPMPFTAYMTDAEGAEVYTGINSNFFYALLSDIVNFYETGDISFDVDETKAVMKLREMVMKASDAPCTWIMA